MKFKVGDKIKYIRGIDKWTREIQPQFNKYKNLIGEIVAIDERRIYPIATRLEKGYTLYVWEPEIELLNENPNCKVIRV